MRGAYDNVNHAWNGKDLSYYMMTRALMVQIVVLLGKKCYLVDIMHDPMAIYAEDSPEVCTSDC